ncbi:phosphate/phosphite/phosphonate ABC transporter substrate-binding protein [Marinospirillum sp.]|uniref:phosphate/phosphite/phosphonate ABC transporter substrate-binding protein n=1 Tax=Marinospirillum sp. TaxID=2183934 RepID=UPI00287047D0|nr:phosphate/phosphite/phosphonate ABC transporter substrate-binding protein [Marinospirillum sp.]MDR9468911.1 phosphate/phosphite/phosphonate ABC transporter substrate-binding protein [Marinospirillum sp.]
MNKMMRTALLSTSLLVLPFAAQAGNLAEVCPSPIRMADTGIEGMGQLRDAFGPFSEEFEAVTGIELAMYSLSNRTAAGNALQFDDVELVFAGPSEFVLFSQHQDMDILFSIERPHYGSSFFVKSASPYQSLADLKGQKIALKDVGSTSGHIFPSQMLVDAGLDISRDLDVVMAGDARIAALVNDDVVALGGGNRDIEKIKQLDPRGDYRVLAKSGKLPGDPIVMRSTLPTACKEGLKTTLSQHSERLWEALIATERNQDKFLNRDSFMSFDITPADYEIVRQAYQAAGIALR